MRNNIHIYNTSEAYDFYVLCGNNITNSFTYDFPLGLRSTMYLGRPFIKNKSIVVGGIYYDDPFYYDTYNLPYNIIMSEVL